MDSLQIKLLSDFLTENAREDLKVVALHELLGLTGSSEGCSMIENTQITRWLTECLLHENEVICKTACLSLVNISATEKGADCVLNAFRGANEQGVIARLLSHILNPESKTSDAACMTLSNLTRQSKTAALVMDYLKEDNIEIDKLINAFTNIKYNSKGCNLHYLGPLFSNLSQNVEFRRQLMDRKKCLIQKLLPFTQFQPSLVRRGGIVGTLRNCCFETGPEEFSEEENDKLPLDLQYLGEDKERETDIDIRKMLLEAIHQLCATKFGREELREKNVYLILREYHKWERDRSVLLACENVVDILIRSEDEINEDNLKALEVPEKYASKFEEMDKQYLQDDC